MVDKYTEERNKQEAEKKAIEEALEMTQPPILTEAEIKEIEELKRQQRNAPTSDYDPIPRRKYDENGPRASGIIDFNQLSRTSEPNTYVPNELDINIYE